MDITEEEQKRKEALKKSRKKYYDNNREKILENLRTWCECDNCGSRVKKVNISRHKRTDRCKELSKYFKTTSKVDKKICV